MRETLIALMKHHKDSEYDLQEKSGVPQPTTYRFLKGITKNANEATAQRWAEAYGVSVSQLRGDLPIEYLDVANDVLDDDYPKNMVFSRSGVAQQPVKEYKTEKTTVAGFIKGLFSLDSGFANIPLMNATASMGEGSGQPDNEIVIDVLRISKSWADKSLTNLSAINNLAFIHGLGDSMSPTFQDGDILLVDTGVKEVVIDGVYVLQAHDRLFIKRVRQRIDGHHEISSDNINVKTVDLLNGDHEVNVLGRVVWVWNGRKL